MNDEFPDRKRLRLKYYDYSNPGYYFITICTKEKGKFFGDLAGNEIRLNEIGRVVENHISEIDNRYENVVMDCFCILPNHCSPDAISVERKFHKVAGYHQ